MGATRKKQAVPIVQRRFSFLISLGGGGERSRQRECEERSKGARNAFSKECPVGKKVAQGAKRTATRGQGGGR